jgi:hypothetical protein
MKFYAVTVVIAALGIGCASRREPMLVKTQVVTFPDGAVIEYNGSYLGRAPASVILPQDMDGRLTERAVIRALPNSGQRHLITQSRVFDPTNRLDRVPDRVLIDMSRPGTTELSGEIETVRVEKPAAGQEISAVERGKPTQAVGLDRWNPGHH